MRTRIRSLLDLVRFLASAEWVYLAGVAGFVLGSLPPLLDLPKAVSYLVIAVGVVIGVVLVVRDSFGFLGRWSAWTMRKKQTPIDFGRRFDVPGLPLVIRGAAGTVAIDPELDVRLRHSESTVRWQEDKYRLPRTLDVLAPYVLRTSASGKWPFNGPNVGLVGDLTPVDLDGSRDVLVRRGDFFSSLCSNELTGWALAQHGEPFDFTGRYLFDSTGRMLSLDDSELNNNIGVSTLAITTDDHLVVTLQSARSQTSSGLWAPSGSGALEPRDVDGASSSRLTDVIAAGAIRELSEETKISSDAQGRPVVIGYGRWLERGGKPEFFCVTPLRIASSEVAMGDGGQIHGLFADERLWTASVALTRLDLGAPARSGRALSSATHRRPVWRRSGLVSDPSQLHGSISVPLDLALDALARHLQADPHFVVNLRSAADR